MRIDDQLVLPTTKLTIGRTPNTTFRNFPCSCYQCGYFADGQHATKVITLCSQGKREIACDKNEAIYIEKAFWGRRNSSM